MLWCFSDRMQSMGEVMQAGSSLRSSGYTRVQNINVANPVVDPTLGIAMFGIMTPPANASSAGRSLDVLKTKVCPVEAAITAEPKTTYQSDSCSAKAATASDDIAHTFRKTGRRDLLCMLVEQSKRIDYLEAENASLANGSYLPAVAPAESATTADLLDEYNRVTFRKKYATALKSTVVLLLVAIAAAILVVTLWMPVLQVYGTSMTPNLEDGDVVVLAKGGAYDTGDIIAFYYNNKILIKRVVARAGDWVDIQADGTVLVNGVEIDEPYVQEKSLGDCDLEFPYQVPESRVFVLGDHRSVSVDSRSSQVGCVADEQIVGKLLLRVWPISRAALV